MPSHKEDNPDLPSSRTTLRIPKRESQRACDNCRKKKIRCDGPQRDDHTCTYCAKSQADCTYRERTTRREPRKTYVDDLEARLRETEALVKKLCPGLDLEADIDSQLRARASMFHPRSEIPETSSATLVHSRPPAAPRAAVPHAHEPHESSSDEETNIVPLVEQPRMARQAGSWGTFWGKSSPMTLVENALSDLPPTVEDFRRPKFWAQPHLPSSPHNDPADVHLPPPDLFTMLVDAFFQHANVYMNILHQGLFRKQLAAGLHRTDRRFMAILLLVLAIASRCIDDQRALADPEQPRSAGWPYFELVEPMARVPVGKLPTLLDLQIKALTTAFLFGSSSPSACWTGAGVGLRMAEEVGAHRKKVYKETPNLIDELWKRAFWFLVTVDRSLAAVFGRPCGIHDESIDADLPLEVDDECWDVDDAAHNYPLKHQQPEGQPSLLTFLVLQIKIHQVLAFAMRTIYSINKSKVLVGTLSGPQWEQKIMAELDNALNILANSVPDHLHWDPARTDLRWVKQSSGLWCAFYFVQIFIHRRFLEVPHLLQLARKASLAPEWDTLLPATPAVTSPAVCPGSPDQSSKPSRSISRPHPLGWRRSLRTCTRAARTCTHVLAERLRQFPRDLMLPYQAIAAGTCGIVLLFSVWADEGITVAAGETDESSDSESASSSESEDPDVKDVTARMADVHLCMDAVKYMERWWHRAGQAWDLLNELATAPELISAMSAKAAMASSLSQQPRRLRPLLPRPVPHLTKPGTAVESHADDPISAGPTAPPHPAPWNDTAPDEWPSLTGPAVTSTNSGYTGGLSWLGMHMHPNVHP